MNFSVFRTLLYGMWPIGVTHWEIHQIKGLHECIIFLYGHESVSRARKMQWCILCSKMYEFKPQTILHGFSLFSTCFCSKNTNMSNNLEYIFEHKMHHCTFHEKVLCPFKEIMRSSVPFIDVSLNVLHLFLGIKCTTALSLHEVESFVYTKK